MVTGRLRSDLYYRLSAIELVAPASRERCEDIPCLTAAIVREFSQRFRKPLTGPRAPPSVCQLKRRGAATFESCVTRSNEPAFSRRGHFSRRRRYEPASRGRPPATGWRPPARTPNFKNRCRPRLGSPTSSASTSSGCSPSLTATRNSLPAGSASAAARRTVGCFAWASARARDDPGGRDTACVTCALA